MPNRQILRNLKNLDLSGYYVTLAVIKEYKRERISHYTVKYVPIDAQLETKLRNILLRHITSANTVETYTFDCPEPEEDEVRSIVYEETDFYTIFTQLQELNPETDIIENVDELVKSKAYMIILRNAAGIQVVGFKTLPENWKMKRSRDLINVFFNENKFEDLEQENVFSIAKYVDFLYFNDYIFILSKKEFERGLNFRKGMISNAQALYTEVVERNIFVNINLLTQRVGNNQRYLRKITTIRNLGHYTNPLFLQRLQELSLAKGWNIQFEENQILITEETLDSILTLLQNKRLHSELTEEDFDVDSAKLLNLNV
ncbi:Kiwa anti-phage protein KwaB-like domain-containing protein [uncultured Flavobacterium sp.]|uniref:Kiwa anti-phage protein KwaB-like domain-containing protein n=1 Tax=uncultured Flavobacterium sp. TaxID=165435 RepID=UPI002601E8AB|nr:Kiwa anti-phage protein KwaB-like domain-containing protein [uncultured Flavobacterium sp.]